MTDSRTAFEQAIAAFQGDVAAAAVTLNWDSAVRRQYQAQIERMAQDLQLKAMRGQMTWQQAAAEANQARNAVMDVLRSRSTVVGRALAEQMKAQGRTLNELIAHYTIKLHGKNAIFDSLSQAERNAVYAEIVAAAGRSNPRVNMAMARVSRVGRGLVVLSVAVSVYNVATAEDKVDAVMHEGAATGAGILGGAAGGALAGLACGPGAPVCVTIGVFVGGAAAALGVDWLW